MSTIRIPTQQRFILDSVTWERYSRLLREFSDRHLRITYDRGFLEIMTLSFEHESLAAFLGRLIVTLTEELHLPIEEGRSTTLRRKRKQKGLEPDNCYWIAHASSVRGKKKIDLRIDPPPDLAIEVDISRSSLNRMGIYAKLGVPEVWRYGEQGLAFFTLNTERIYVSASVSALFPLTITPLDLTPFLDLRDLQDKNDVVRQFRGWIQTRLGADSPP